MIEEPDNSTRPGGGVPASRARIAAAFAAVYLFWGSSYLGIRFAIETIPPFLMGGARFLIAGAILYGWGLLRESERPSMSEWKSMLVVGAFLILGGNGSVVWAEQYIPSGLTAMLIATEPLWIVLLLWGLGRERLRPSSNLGLVLGFGGVLVLVGPENLVGAGRVDPVAALVVVLGTVSWAIGSLYSRSVRQPRSGTLSTGMSMICGGVLMIIAGSVRGEFLDLDPSSISLKSGLAFGYLVLFPSLGAFSSYLWLLKTTSPDRASTYAYVNPVVAVILGWALAGEAINPRLLLSIGVILLSLWLVMKRSRSSGTLSGPEGSDGSRIATSDSRLAPESTSKSEGAV
jgi:drug/metabolite transporter (DMT)-like permease